LSSPPIELLTRTLVYLPFERFDEIAPEHRLSVVPEGADHA
jgi:hypothetical protein